MASPFLGVSVGLDVVAKEPRGLVLHNKSSLEVAIYFVDKFFCSIKPCAFSITNSPQYRSLVC